MGADQSRPSDDDSVNEKLIQRLQALNMKDEKYFRERDEYVVIGEEEARMSCLVLSCPALPCPACRCPRLTTRPAPQYTPRVKYQANVSIKSVAQWEEELMADPKVNALALHQPVLFVGLPFARTASPSPPSAQTRPAPFSRHAPPSSPTRTASTSRSPPRARPSQTRPRRGGAGCLPRPMSSASPS